MPAGCFQVTRGFGYSWAKACFSFVSDGTNGTKNAIMESNCRMQPIRRSGGLEVEVYDLCKQGLFKFDTLTSDSN